MALFKKKLTLDEILAGIDGLSEEEKAKVGEKMKDLYKAEDEREIDKIEKEKADTPEETDEKAEDEREESEEIGDDVDDVEEEVEEDEDEDEDEEEKSEKYDANHIEAERNEMNDIRSDIAELKKIVTALAARFDADDDNEEDDEDVAWGVSAKDASVEKPIESETEKYRRKYFNF